MKRIFFSVSFISLCFINYPSFANNTISSNIGCETLANTSWSGSTTLSDGVNIDFKIYISGVQYISDGFFSIDGTMNNLPFNKGQGYCYEFTMPYDNHHGVAGIRIIQNNEPSYNFDLTGYIAPPGNTNPTTFINLSGVWTYEGDFYRIEGGQINKN